MMWGEGFQLLLVNWRAAIRSVQGSQQPHLEALKRLSDPIWIAAEC